MMDIPTLLSTLTDQVKPALSNQFLSGGLVLGMIAGVLASLRRIPHHLWDIFLKTCTVTINVRNDEKPFFWVMLWLNHHPYARKTRRVAVRYYEGKVVCVPAHGWHFFLWNRRPLWIEWIDENSVAGGGGTDLSSIMKRERIQVRFFGRDRTVITAFLAEAEALAQEDLSSKLTVYYRQGSWGPSWEMEPREKRPLASVFLPKEAEGIVADMQRFLKDEKWHREIGIPYRRGYLFVGPAGTGKSSAAIAMASELNLPLYVLNLGTMTNDGALEQAIYGIDTGKPVILLIEDIDTALPDRELDKEKKHFSLGTLLNVLDGVLARENLILITTTNKQAVLDPALIRPGRIDKIVHFNLATQPQMDAAAQLFCPNDVEEATRQLAGKAGQVSMAEVQEVLRVIAQSRRYK